MVMTQRNEHPHAVRVMHTAPLNNWSRRWPRTHEIRSRPTTTATSTGTTPRVTSATTSTANTTPTTMSTATATSVQHQRLQRATDPKVMGENDFNRTSRMRRQVLTTATTTVATTSTSPKSTLSNSVQIVPPPPPTVIDLTVESIEDLMMADVQEQKAASDNETSANQPIATKGKRKHVATGNPRGRPPRDSNKDGDCDKGQELA